MEGDGSAVQPAVEPRRKRIRADDAEPEVRAQDTTDASDQRKKAHISSSDRDDFGGDAAPGGAEAFEDEDDDEDDSDEDDDNDYDGLAEGPDDRRKLGKMSELERELELSERAERRQMQRERRMLISGLPEAGRSSEPAPKPPPMRRKQESAPRRPRPVEDEEEEEDDDGEKTDVRRSSRAQPAGKATKAEALQKMLKTRQRKDEAAVLERTLEEEVEAVVAEDAEEGEAYDQSDEDEEGDYGRGIDLAEELRDERDVDDAYEATFEDVQKMQVIRSYIEEWIPQPFLNDTLIGCIVRVSAAARSDSSGQQDNVYAMCPILDVTTGPQYKLGTGTATDKYLVVRNGRRTQNVPILLVSNTLISKDEFLHFHTQNADADEPQIQKHQTQEVAEKLSKARSYTLTAEDLNRIVREKREKGQFRQNQAVEKGRLQRERDELLERGEHEKAAEVEERLNKLRAAIKEQQMSVRGLKGLNTRARKTNFQGLKASHDPNRANKSQAAPAFDPFERRVTRPIQYWSTKAADPATTGAAAPEQKPAAAKAVVSADAESIMRQVRWSVDKSLLQHNRVQPLVARRLLGPRWHLTSDKILPLNSSKEPQLLTLAQYQYKQKAGLH